MPIFLINPSKPTFENPSRLYVKSNGYATPSTKRCERKTVTLRPKGDTSGYLWTSPSLRAPKPTLPGLITAAPCILSTPFETWRFFRCEGL